MSINIPIVAGLGSGLLDRPETGLVVDLPSLCFSLLVLVEKLSEASFFLLRIIFFFVCETF